jgi:quinolinate synthase
MWRVVRAAMLAAVSTSSDEASIRSGPRPAVVPSASPEELALLREQVLALARERDAVILAHNYQRPEVQDVADFVGDSLGLARSAAAGERPLIAFCGVHFMAETASVLCPEKTVLLPDLRAGCSLAETITAHELQEWKAAHPGAIVVMYVNTSAEVKAETDYCCTSSNAVQVVEHVWREHGEDTEILFGPDMWLGAFVQRRTGGPMHLWSGECHVHAGIRPHDIEQLRDEHPDAEFLIHPECGCTSSVMEFMASGDVRAARCHMLSTGGMLDYARRSDAEEFVVATEVGLLYPLRAQNPGKRFIAMRPEPVCEYMKTITLENLRDALLHGRHEVRVPPEIAERARLPIERMVTIA